MFLPGFGGKLGASFSKWNDCVVELNTRSSRELFKLFLNLLALFMPLVVRRLANIGDTLSIEMTKFDGNTPMFSPSFPRHHPSSTLNITF